MPNARNIIRNKGSKRLTLHKKHKIERKIREHKRSVRKSGELRHKKDPGIPNLWPFKEELLQQMERARAKKAEEAEAEKLERQRLREKKKQQSMQELAAKAARAGAKFERKAGAGSGAGEPSLSGPPQLGLRGDASRRAYMAEFRKVVEASDVILEVLDARDPLGCRCLGIERYILGRDPSKRIILVLNKIDLVPRDVVERWLRYLRDDLPTVAFKCSTQNQRAHLGHAAAGARADEAPEHALRTAECLGGDTLLQLLKNYARSQDLKTSVTVGIIGYPNVGKSSLINSLKRSKAVGVGATPGFTKAMQEIHLDKNVKLLDCPGIVFSTGGGDGQSGASEADVVLRNAVKLELLADPVAPVEAIVRRCRADHLQLLYGIPQFASAQEFLAHVARKKGKLKKGGVPDVEAAARTVLQDWNGGKIAFFTLPPEKPGVHLGAAIVPAWGPHFDADGALLRAESAALAQLPASADRAGFVQMEAVAPSAAADAALLSALTAAPTADMEDVDGDEGDEDEDEDEEGDEEEEGDEDEDGQASMELDAGAREDEALHPAPRGAGPAAAVPGPARRVQQRLLRQEETLNPQANRNRKKQLKAARKHGKRGASQDEEEEEGDDD